MGLRVLLAFFYLLLTVASPRRDVSSRACSSSEFKDELHLLNSSAVHLTLHHPRSPCSPARLPESLPFSTLLLHDDARASHLSARAAATAITTTTHSPRRPTSLSPLLDSAASTPLNPGRAVGVGNYVASIGIGSPAKSYVFVVDTGSSLSWLQCSPCLVSCHVQSGSIYNPSASATYRRVSCTAPDCNSLAAATLNPSACSRSNVCIYQASYGDGSFSVGYLSEDTVTFGGRSFPGVVLGCGQDNEGLFGQSAGLIGLARNRLSFFDQLAKTLGSSFSYCLSSPSSTGYLSIGANNAGQFSYTPMGSVNSLYAVKLAGITVAGRSLPVAGSAYTSSQTIIDSGTVISRLPSSVYSALSAAVAAAMKGSQKAPAYSILDTCYKGQAATLPVPKVALVFQGGAAIQLPPSNVLIDVDGSTSCLAFAPSSGVAIIGNTQQQTFAVAYDVAGSRIGFAPAGCR